MERGSTLYTDAYDVDNRLHRLGLSRGPLIEAVRQGDLQRRLCTSDDFAATPGFFAWAVTLRVMRAELRLSHRFHNGSFLRIPVSYNEAESIAIATSSADAGTGAIGDDPVTRTKGPSTVQAVEENIPTQLPLDIDEGVELWYLLFHGRDDGSVFAELSKPRDLDTDGQISRWYERVLLGNVGPDDGKKAKLEPAPTPTIDIPLRRKTG